MFLFLLLCFIASASNATILTVSNNTLSPAQYNNITDAIAAAGIGDTIYIHGTAMSYGGMIVDKPLHIFGTGHHPRKQLPFKSTIGALSFTTNAGTTTIDGLIIGGIDANLGLHDITIRNCDIGGASYGYTWGNTVPMNNWLIENCIIRGTTYFNGNVDLNNWIFRNNIIYNRLFDITSPITFDHNLFYGLSFSVAFSNVNSAIISNSIFYMMEPGNANNVTFLNNITYNTSNNTIPYGTNTGSGNIIGQDPLFVSFPPAGADFDITQNFNLQASSPGDNAATDGTDIGPEGGINGFSMSGEPWLPQIRSFNIANSTVPVGGQINISVTATKAEGQ